MPIDSASASCTSFGDASAAASIPACAYWPPSYPRDPRRGNACRPSQAHWTDSNSPTSICRNAKREMCWGSANPAGPSHCDSFRSPNTSTSLSPHASSAKSYMRRTRHIPEWPSWQRSSPIRTESNIWTRREPQPDAVAGPHSVVGRSGRLPGDGVLAGIAEVPVRIRSYDYRRDAFGDSWTDDNPAPGGHNGCDTRNDILDRDLADKTYVSIKRCPDA